MSGQPDDWEPDPNTLYQCINCDLVFKRAEPVILDGETIWRCPECCEDEFFGLHNTVIWGIFYDIISQGWNESERFVWRLRAEQGMGPFNPISRDL